MLPPFIIDQIRRREEDERRQHEGPTVQLPLPTSAPQPREQHTREDEPKRGVVIIELG